MNTGEIYVFGPFRLDPSDKTLLCAGKPVALTPKAFDTLQILLEHHGRMVAKEVLMKRVWPESFVEENNLSQNISALRKALDRKDGVEYIETIPKRGYRFIGDVRTERTVEPVAAAPNAGAATAVAPAAIPDTKYAQSGDINIAYQVLGDGPIDLVFVMGWVSHLEYFWTEPRFARFLRRLASFSRLILFDKRGTGLSDRVPLAALPTLEQRMDDVRAVLEAVGSDSAVLCGISEGGPMSALFAATYPEKTLGLVMIGTYAKRIRDAEYPWGPTEEQRQHFLDEIASKWGGPVGLEERAPTAADDPKFREWWATYLRMCASPGAAVALTKMNAQIDVRDVLPTVRVPTLVIHRTGDTCLRVEEGRYVAGRIPGARFVELPGIDHLPFVGDQDAILHEVDVFLRNLRPNPDLERVLATVLFVHLTPGAGVSTDLVKRFEVQARREVEWFGGRKSSSLSEGPLATFDGPARAIRCACSIVEHGVKLGLPIAAGLHTGECDRMEDGGVGGTAVEVARTIVRKGKASDVLVSRTVRDLVAGSGLRFDPAGRMPLAGELGELPLFRVR